MLFRSVDIASSTITPTPAPKTVAGVLNGSGAFSKSGAGTLVVTGGSAYTGTTSILAGTLQVGDAGTSGNLGSGAITNNANLVFKRSDAVGIANVISGTGNVKQEGSGTLTLSAANTYIGKTYVNAGTLAISQDSNLGAAPSSVQADQLVVNNASVYFYPVFSSSSVNRGLTLFGSGTFNTSTGSTVAWAGPITGDNLVKVGAGSLSLTNTNSHASTAVNAGILYVSADEQLGSVPSTSAASAVILDGGTLQATTSFTTATNRGLRIDSNGGTIMVDTGLNLVYAGGVSGAGALEKTGAGNLVLGGALTYTGSTTTSAGGLIIRNAAPTWLTSAFAGSGDLTIEPVSTSFTSPVTLNSAQFGLVLGSLTVGKMGNTQNILMQSNITTTR
mgnify:FL=1